jgi:hypothetical protein
MTAQTTTLPYYQKRTIVVVPLCFAARDWSFVSGKNNGVFVHTAPAAPWSELENNNLTVLNICL